MGQKGGAEQKAIPRQVHDVDDRSTVPKIDSKVRGDSALAEADEGFDESPGTIIHVPCSA